MKKIKIIINAFGCTGDDFDAKEVNREKLLDKDPSDARLTVNDLEQILESMIASVKEIKVLYPDEQTGMSYHHDNRVESIKFFIEFSDEKGNVQKLEEKEFFENVAEHPVLAPKVLEYCRVTDDGEEGTRIWIADEFDEGPPAGTFAILGLVHQDKKWIPDYIEFLRTNDLDHEVEQQWQIKGIIDKYGWCNETSRLAIARNVSCCGQGGTQQFKEFIDNGLGDYIKQQENRPAFLKDITREFLDYESTDHGKKLLNDSKEYYMKWRSEELEGFEFVLTEDEKVTIKEEIARRWDLFNREK